ncbi:hypothetical protein B296_00042412 [Ensete ventricosum]|uniref:Uncharacterized protein n=1 Tax=Ensete ventricosum TaxID=4639 RepID=A0A426Y1X8_ENSVE|nr:hypothetical protein B296_00042412 [Ensete ventricosum]
MPSAWVAAPSVGAAALGRHLVGGRCCPYWRALLLAAALVGGSPSYGATPCGLAAGSRYLRPGYDRCLGPQVPAMPAGGRACWQLPLTGWLPLEMVYPCIPDPDGEDEGDHRDKRRKLLVIESVEDPEPKDVNPELEKEDTEKEPQSTISTIHTLAGYANPQSMKVNRFLKH